MAAGVEAMRKPILLAKIDNTRRGGLKTILPMSSIWRWILAKKNQAEIIEKKDTGVEIAFAPVGETLIELLHYTKPTQAKRSIVREQKGAINHICFEVDDLEEAIRYFEERGLKVAKGYPASGAHGRIAFFEPSTTEGVLIEICQV
jgi:methylmalonyl-CoA/ethylmalonyl-CoA epimerase